MIDPSKISERKTGLKKTKCKGTYSGGDYYDEDCANYIIDAEECIINNNSFHPSPPPLREYTAFEEFYEARRKTYVFKTTTPMTLSSSEAST